MVIAARAEDPRLALAWEAARAVCDPEIPVLTLDDLGALHGVEIAADDVVEVAITPTYSGCPAMKTMELDLLDALARAGILDARVKTVLAPAWTTDGMSAAGREKLRAYGIAPPVGRPSRRARFGAENSPPCPRCDCARTAKISEFGSTACKSLWRCEACLEPFDAFKCI